MSNSYYELKKEIREQFMENVRKEYARKKMSGNLAKSMRKRTIKRHGIVSVYIEAPIYDIWKYWYERVIVPLNIGSYAEDNDAGSGGLKRTKRNQKLEKGYRIIPTKDGSLRLLPTHNHNEFVERNIVPAIQDTLSKYRVKKYTIKMKGK